MFRQFWLKLCLSAVSICMTLGILEIGVRLLTARDADGAPRFRLTRLKPYVLPVARVQREMTAYLSSDKTTLLYDPELGWRPRPGILDANADGFRTTSPTPNRQPTPGTLRIALFGDSFTEGPEGGGWWRVLEQRLNADGIKCEVLNFGVGGYGMDQAYLRWKKEGILWKPDVVLFGFFVDDCYRNLNLLRLLRDPDSGIALMKPRFVLDGDGLSLINSPTPDPAKLPNLVRDFASWPLAPREHYFHEEDFRMTPWRWSRLGALIEAKSEFLAQSANAKEFFRIDGEAAQVALRILRQMHQEVSATGAAFYVANLPCAPDLTDMRESGRMPQSDLLKQLSAEHEVIDTEPALLAAGKDHKFLEFFVDGHYKAEFHKSVGEVIADHLRQKHPHAVTRN
jgi:hypothetical protein